MPITIALIALLGGAVSPADPVAEKESRFALTSDGGVGSGGSLT